MPFDVKRMTMGGFTTIVSISKMTRIVATLASLALLGASAATQPGRKVFISADMEGISGISASDQLSAAGAEYGRSRKMMADDVNAAIRGPRRRRHHHRRQRLAWHHAQSPPRGP